jgi:hypothetical protein
MDAKNAKFLPSVIPFASVPHTVRTLTNSVIGNSTSIITAITHSLVGSASHAYTFVSKRIATVVSDSAKAGKIISHTLGRPKKRMNYWPVVGLIGVGLGVIVITTIASPN